MRRYTVVMRYQHVDGKQFESPAGYFFLRWTARWAAGITASELHVALTKVPGRWFVLIKDNRTGISQIHASN